MTCPKERNNRTKDLLIPHVVMVFRNPCLKEFTSLWEGPASHQLVGKVTAYQGDDG